MTRFCQHHWDLLRKAVEKRGMMHLVAKSGEDAFANELDGLMGTKVEANWDPLMAAHWNIAGMVLQNAGLSAMGQCPLCIVQDSYAWWDSSEASGPRPPEAADAQEWIDGCMDAMLAYAKETGKLDPITPKPDPVP